MGTIKTALLLLFLSTNAFAFGTDGCTNKDVLLLHFDGANASTSFGENDCDGNGKKVFTANGNAQLSTTLPKFGSASLLLDGSGDYASSPATADYAVGTGNFTIDFWIKLDGAAASDNTIFTTGGSSGNGIFLEWSSATGNKIAARINSIDRAVNGAGSVSKSVWHHIAFERNGTALLLYVDGVEQGAGLTDSADISPNTYGIDIGREEGNRWFFNGRIDEFRFTKGVAKWTKNFTPPSTPYCSGCEMTGMLN